MRALAGLIVAGPLQAVGLIALYTFPVITVFIEPWFAGERPHWQDVLSALLVVVGASTFITVDPTGPFSKFTTLPIQIYQWTARPQDEFRNIAAAAILVLLVLLDENLLIVDLNPAAENILGISLQRARGKGHDQWEYDAGHFRQGQHGQGKEGSFKPIPETEGTDEYPHQDPAYACKKHPDPGIYTHMDL